MNLNIPVIALLLCLIKIIQSHSGDEMDIVFRERTYADWARIWHQESHSRCRDKLVQHLDWACEKDIYKLTRRNNNNGDGGSGPNEGKEHNGLIKVNSSVRKKSAINPWLSAKDVAKQMLRTRRNGGKGITSECCTRAGCTWEEYAEYCPSNKRRNVK